MKRSAFRKRSVARRVCEASSDRFSADFQSVRARGDMRKTNKNHRFLHVFHKSSLLRARGPARAKERRKVSKIDPPDLPNPPKSLPKGDVGSLEASRRASRIDLGSLEASRLAPREDPGSLECPRRASRSDLGSLESPKVAQHARGTPEAISPNSTLDIHGR